MSCPNFETQKLFPLYAIDDNAYWETQCDECAEWVNMWEWEEYGHCPYCGCETHGETHFDEWLFQDDADLLLGDCMEQSADKLKFFEIGIQSGYSFGLQLIVRLTETARYVGFDIDGNTDCVENEDTKYYYDCCRSVCIRQFEREQRKVVKLMEQIAQRHRMDEYVCGGIFSNGAAVYYRVNSENERERLYAAANKVA